MLLHTPQASTLANKSLHCNLQRFCFKKILWSLQISICIYFIYVHVLMHRPNAYTVCLLKYISGSQMCIVTCTCAVFHVKSISKPSNSCPAKCSAVWRSLFQGLRSLGSAESSRSRDSTLETCHAETSNHFKHAMSYFS